MKNWKSSSLSAAMLFFALAIFSSGVFAQGGNTISGQVLGYEREPIYDIYVELQNDYQQAINRVRTDGSGRYFFFGMSAGRYTIRVVPYGTDYEEQVQDVEIFNLPLNREDQQGNRRQSGYVNEQRDIYLKLKKGITPSNSGVIFVQEVPDAAKKLYQKAIGDLNDKKQKEGLAGLIAAIDIFPKYFAALERLGNEYIALKQYKAAQVLFSNALEVNPRGYRSWHGLAHSAYSLNDYELAAGAIQKSLEIYADSPDALLLSGILKRIYKKYDESEKQLLKAKQLTDAAKIVNPMIHLHLALLYGNDLKRYANAAKELKLYLKSSPNLQNKEEYEKLIKTFEEKAAAEKSK